MPPTGQRLSDRLLTSRNSRARATPTARFPAPLLARPDDLVTVPQGETLPGLDPALQAARRTDAGYEPYPDRAAIEDGALGARASRSCSCASPVEAFIVHVQGSARIRLPDGARDAGRLCGPQRPSLHLDRQAPGRAGRDGRSSQMTLERLMAWLREHPEQARALMRQNRSYIFFRAPTSSRRRTGRSAAPAFR